MFRFLSALFEPEESPSSSKLPESLLEKAIERVVMGTDRRLRALPQYQNQLREPVECAVLHVLDVVNDLPPAKAISPLEYGDDLLLRAFFASPEHMREVFARLGGLKNYLSQLNQPPELVYGLMTMMRDERNVFGMELDGDELRRDVMKVSVSFTNHRFFGPTASEHGAKREIQLRAFDFLLEKALQRLIDEQGKRRELDRQRTLLQNKLAALRSGKFGLNDCDEAESPKALAEIEDEIEAIDAELGEVYTDSLSLEESLGLVAETLSHPKDWLAIRQQPLDIDYRGIKQEQAQSDVLMTELYSHNGDARTLLFGSIAPADIPPPPDLLKKASYYL